MKKIGKLMMILLGCVIYSAGIAIFLDPNNLAPGGVTGIAIMVNYITGLGTGLLMLLFNLPLMALGLYFFGKEFLFSTVFATVVSSFLIDLISGWTTQLPPITTDLLLSGLVGGALVSVGMGIIFRCGGTTGGADIIVKILRRKYRHLKTNTLFLMFDLLVVTASAFVFRNLELALYACVILFIQSYVLDMVLYGADGAKLVYIISDDAKHIAQRFMNELGIGVTFLEGKGAYTEQDKEVLMSVIRRQHFPKLRDIVKEEDENAFMIVTSATEIYGEGYKSHDVEEL